MFLQASVSHSVRGVRGGAGGGVYVWSQVTSGGVHAWSQVPSEEQVCLVPSPFQGGGVGMPGTPHWKVHPLGR